MTIMTDAIKAEIKGTVSGQVAVGNYILQIGDVNGGVVNIAPPTAQPIIEPRPRPVNMKPRPFPSLLDRVVETASIKSAFETSAPVSIFGTGGMGKTSLLRRAAHLPEANNFSDGVVYLSAKDQGLDDLLQLLFDAFHTSPPNTKPTDGQIRNGLQDIKAFILLDDISLERDSIEALLNDMPASMFVFASMDRSLWGEGQIVSLHGLPETEALMLFEKELGRFLSDSETGIVKEILSTLEDQPLRILHVASSARETGRSISEMREQLEGQDSDAAVVQLALGALSESQKKILAVLAAADAVVPFQHVANLAEVNQPKKILDSLMILGLVQAHSPRYSLTAVTARTLPNMWDISAWEDVLINYFSKWTAEQPTHGLMEDAMDVLLAVMQKANDKKRWNDVIQLGRAIEPSLVFLKRWQGWSEILSMILAAARASGDRKVEGWALHQLGSRALCVEMNDQAHEMLTQALDIRQAIGDKAGLAITQHNLSLLSKPPSPPKTRIRRGFGRWLGIFIASVLAATLVGVGYAYSGSFVSSLMPSQTVKATYTSAPTRTFTPSQTSTFTFTPSNTPTKTSTLTSSATFTFTPTLTFTFTPSRTPTRIPSITSIPADLAGPFPPDILSPYDGDSTYFYCGVDSKVFLHFEWNPSSDPSGITQYQIKINYEGQSIPADNYKLSGDQTSLDIYVPIPNCIDVTITWKIRAQDGSPNQNWGSFSPTQYIYVIAVPG